MAQDHVTITTNNPYGSLTLKDLERAMGAFDFNSGHYEWDYKTGGVAWVSDKPEDKGVEEWVWITGYKGTDKNMRCRDYQYEMNKQHDMPEDVEIDICRSGFHFCDKIEDVFRYYDVANGNRFFEVKALVRRWNKDGNYTIEHNNDKMVAKSIQFVRELTTYEIFEHLDDPRTVDWTYEQMCTARDTSIQKYQNSLKVKELTNLGYSDAFATWAVERCAYDIARTMGSMPDVSMDVKVLTVCMAIYN